MKNRIRYTVDRVLRNTFYQVPKFLFEGEFKGLTNDAKMLYGILKDRHELSVKNKWINGNGEVYLIMTRETMCDLLGLSLKTVIKAVNDLKKYNLLEEERIGLGKPNLLYLLECENLSTVFSTGSKSRDGNFTGQDKETIQPRDGNFTGQDVEFLQPNHINHNQINQNQTDSSYTESIYQAEMPISTLINQPDNPIIHDYDFSIKACNPFSQHHIFKNLSQRYLNRNDDLKRIEDLISEINSSPRTSVRVGKKDISIYDVRDALSCLTARHIESVLNSLDKKFNSSNSNVKNFKPYLLTALYNAATAPYIPFDLDFVKNTVDDNINLISLQRRFPNKLGNLQELRNIIVEVLISRKDYFRIARGNLPSATVKQAFANLNFDHILYVMESLNSNTAEVKSMKAYLQTTLYNAYTTMHNFRSLDSQHILYNHLGISPQ
jgi:hypothetical protein